ncbi:hypothetical protein NL459_28820, partial [Klebsiella pneumoniae]|nr:hypothetical protein [Klebsiella pneumoniae]
IAQISQWGAIEETTHGQKFETLHTTLSVFAADVAGVEAGAQATVDGEDYRVRVILPDARGLVTVVLE